MPLTLSGDGEITGMDSANSTDLSSVYAQLAGPTFTGSVALPATTALGGVTLRDKVIQIVSSSHSTATSSSTNTYVDTGLTATITPTSASNVILVFVSQNGCNKSAGNVANGMNLRIMRGATQLAVIGNNLCYTGTASDNVTSTSAIVADVPGTTSPTTYKTQFMSNNNTASVTVQTNAVTSTIVLVEVKP